MIDFLTEWLYSVFLFTLLHQLVRYHSSHPSCLYAGVVKLLLTAGFNIHVNAVNYKGDTALHIAVTLRPWNGEHIHLLTELLEVLFDGGAHHDFVNNDGKTTMDVAQTDEARVVLLPFHEIWLLFYFF